jgi:hypothetical protein
MELSCTQHRAFVASTASEPRCAAPSLVKLHVTYICEQDLTLAAAVTLYEGTPLTR